LRDRASDQGIGVPEIEVVARELRAQREVAYGRFLEEP
jgi:hypothetical protein